MTRPWVLMAVAVGLVLAAVTAAGVGYLAWGWSQDRAARDAYAEYVAEMRAAHAAHHRSAGSPAEWLADRPPTAEERRRFDESKQAAHAEMLRHAERADELEVRWAPRWRALGLRVPPD